MEIMQRIITKEKIKKILTIILGTFIASIGINALYIPNNILAGGISGIAMLFHLTFGWHISIVILLLNIPIFIVGYRMVNKEFVFYSFIGMISLTICLALTKGVTFYSNELLTTILLGGLINGLGFGLVFKVNASTGGNDIISKIIHKKFSYSIPTLNFAFNILIVGLSTIFFGVDMAIRTLATMYVTSTVIKFIIEGLNYKRTVFIISNNEEAVCRAINMELNRGCTIIDGTGSYTKRPRQIIYSVIGISQLAKLKSIVSAIDPSALINVMETRVVFGNGKGFLSMTDNE